MGHDIKKDTYIEADEPTTKALTYDLINGMYIKLEETAEFHARHLPVCEAKFKALDNRKRKDTAVSVASGFGGGFVAVATTWLKKYLGGP